MEAGSQIVEPPRFLVRDAIFVWLGAFFAASATVAVAFTVTDGNPDHDLSWPVRAWGLAAQMAATALGCSLACRKRATGSMRRDLGFLVRIKDWWLVGGGALLAVVLGGLVFPLFELFDVESRQDVVDDLRSAGGGELVTLVLAAGLLAPVVEELLFRGLLLRALRRRYSANWAIGISSVAFGAVHLLDFSVGTLIVLPALITLGVVSAVLAVRTGTLSQSILLHVGFNLPTVLGALLT
jgi:membrane protease YdiL (CAAX protease family)